MDTRTETVIAELTARVRQPPTLEEALRWLAIVSLESDQASDYVAVIRAAIPARASRQA